MRGVEETDERGAEVQRRRGGGEEGRGRRALS